jgi:exodeoxyribonuclease VII large subunit
VRKFTVSALTAELDRLISGRYPALLVEGEVAQIQVPASGHCYLTLRDRVEGARGARGAQLGGVCWRDTWRNLAYRPRIGDQVVCRGRLGLYGERGVVQLYVNDIQPAGKGLMAEEIARRIARLRADGLLDPARKRPLPPYPRFVGLATSRTGAALQDFLEVSRERFPAARVLLAPCLVQGETAPASVLGAVDLLVQDGRSEVVVVTRGGGSKEDLLPFQDEQLARFLAGCPVPVVSAVGHQVDTTIADLVADAVAPTPSAAALAVLPDGQTLRQRVDEVEIGLRASMDRVVWRQRERVDGLRSRLVHPRRRLEQVRVRAAELEERLQVGLARFLDHASARVRALEGQLDALSPEAVLGRGYAIVTGPDGVVTDPGQVADGDSVEVRVQGGRFGATVSPRSPTSG